MHISEFIEKNVEPIVGEWVKFAQTRLPPSHRFTHEELADHAKVLLLAIATDVAHAQGVQATHDKAQGNKPDNAPEVTRIARQHAAQRFEQGFSVDHLVSEFRALRASVIRTWTKEFQQADREDLDELTRFGESMDQALSESASFYSKKVDDSRNLLLGVLGHDLRTPLGVIHMSAHYLLRADTLTGTQTKTVARILTAAERMKRMVKDILDFTQTAFGVALPIAPAAADIAQVAQDIRTEVSTLYPDAKIELSCEGDLSGRWDVARIAQMLANLIANAVQHGEPGHAVTVSLHGEDGAVRVQVHNEGPPISLQAQENLFSPLRQAPTTESNRHVGSSGLGLGLYITREIAVAHGGSVDVTSDEGGTTFCVHLPRTPPLSAERRAGNARPDARTPG